MGSCRSFPPVGPYETVQHEIDEKVAQLVAKSAGLSLADALCEVMKDRTLYERYTKAAADPMAADAKPTAFTHPPSHVPAVAATLEADLRKTALVLSPSDPFGMGLVKLRKCLEEIQHAVQRRRAA